MKKSELKEIIKPIVQECIRENVQQILLESGLLSSVISEVVHGLQKSPADAESKPIVSESKKVTQTVVRDPDISKKIEETRTKLMSAIGKDSYGGVNIFEGTTPMKPDNGSSSGALKDRDPTDAGVDLSTLTNPNWGKLI
tara:strand:- start:5568 stop:5987 length:420 start_codon:yes stop_codon:yes gene_type:complete